MALRYFSILRFFGGVFWHIRSLFALLFSLLFVGSVIISIAESIPLGDSIYFSFITALTIGYGEITPTTTVGRIASICIGFVGMFSMGLVVAASAQAIRESLKKSGDS